MTLIKASKSEHKSIPWYTPLLAFLAIFTAFVGLLFLTACMKRYDATYSAAMFVGSFVVSASIMAAVHYATFAHLVGVVNWILYPGGLLVLMSGVWILVKEKGAVVESTSSPGRTIEESEEDTSESSAPGTVRVELVRLSFGLTTRFRMPAVCGSLIAILFFCLAGTTRCPTRKASGLKEGRCLRAGLTFKWCLSLIILLDWRQG